MKPKSVERKLKRYFRDQTEYLPALSVEGITQNQRSYSISRLQKPILIALTAYLTVSLVVLAFVAVQSIDQTEPAISTTQSQDTIEPKRYYDENGVFVSENVPIAWDMEQTFVDTSDVQPMIGSNNSYTMNTGVNIVSYLRGIGSELGTVAIVEKIGSVSYYKAYEDGRTPMAYTLSTLRILELPYHNDHQLSVGDVVTIMETYAFSPEDPERIYHSHFGWESWLLPAEYGILSTDSAYLVLLCEAPSHVQYFYCYETGKESSERFPLDDVYFCFSDIYPLSGEIYESLPELREVDYHVSMCNDRDTWYWGYYQACSRIIWEKEKETE